ncbi:MAG: cyclic nucleotide-binding domain-containing protein [Spirochaetaceae bacterium]|jgi:CRP-like cAMP-binding protein|nr:cyclic nucleotide-binding domain-containing protein [Spirochaetaceae bacterium]
MPIEQSFPVVDFSQGTTILKPDGKLNECFYVIRSGKVWVSGAPERARDGGRECLETGDFFSVVSALAQKPVSLTAVAGTDVTLTVVTKDNFAGFIEGNLPVCTKILKYLSARLRLLNEELTYGEKPVLNRADLAYLYNFGIYYLKQNLFRSAYCAFYQYLKYCPEGENSKMAQKYLHKFSSYASGIKFDYYEKDIIRKYPLDAAIFFEYEPSDGMYVIRNGAIKITKITNDREVVLAVLKPGDILGEMGLIDSQPRSATAIAYTDCEIMAIARTAYLPILKDGANITDKICVTLSNRIYDIHDRIYKDKYSQSVL